MRPSVPFVAALTFALSGCFNFDSAYDKYCTLNRCDGGGTGGGTGTGGGGSATGGGVGGSAGGGTGGGSTGGGTGGSTGGGVGGSAGGGSGGGSGGGAGGGTVEPACDSGLCFVRNYDVPKLPMWTITAVTPTQVFAGGFDSTLVRWDGVSFTPTKAPNYSGAIWAVDGVSPNAVWSAGDDQGNTNLWNGTDWVPHSSGNSAGTFWGIYALPDGGALAAATSGKLFRWVGNVWTLVGATSPQSDSFDDITGCNGDENVYMVTYSGNVYHYKPDAGFALEYTGTTELESLHCHPTGGVWAVGHQGLVLKRNDATNGWDVQPLGLSGNLYGVWTSDQNETWIVGGNRTLVRVIDGGVTPYNLPPYNLGFYTDISGAGDSIWLTGNYAPSATHDGGIIVQYRVGPP